MRKTIIVIWASIFALLVAYIGYQTEWFGLAKAEELDGFDPWELTIDPEDYLELHPELLKIFQDFDGVMHLGSMPARSADRLWNLSVSTPLFEGAKEVLELKNRGEELPQGTFPEPEQAKITFIKRVLSNPVLGSQLADYFSKLQIPVFDKKLVEVSGNEGILEFKEEFEKEGYLGFAQYDQLNGVWRVNKRYVETAKLLLARFWAFQALDIEARQTKQRYISNADLVSAKDVRVSLTSDEKYQENLESLIMGLTMKGQDDPVLEFGVNLYDASIVEFEEKKEETVEETTQSTVAVVEETTVQTTSTSEEQIWTTTTTTAATTTTTTVSTIEKNTLATTIPKTTEREYSTTTTEATTQPTVATTIAKDYGSNSADNGNAETFGGKNVDQSAGSYQSMPTTTTEPATQPTPATSVDKIDANPISDKPDPVVTTTSGDPVGDNNGEWDDGN